MNPASMKMKSFGTIGSIVLVCATGFLACAQADEAGPTTNVQPDAETIPQIDSGADSEASIESGSTADTTPVCTVGASETRPCGACGTQNHFCLPTGTWTDWTTCTGEKDGTECVVGEKRTSDCGNCGKATDTCDTKTCTWETGSCTGEGECAPGDEETTKASCADPAQLRKRTCSDSCKWSTFSACEMPKGWLTMPTAPITGRGYHSAVWTGTDMIIWGGGYSSGTSLKNDGASYNLASDKWKTIATTSLSARRNHGTAWTGSKMIVWGGYDGSSSFYKDGAIYDPSADSWTSTGTSPLTARHSPAVVWSTTTNELLVWSGCTSGWCTAVASDGAAYNPATNSWTALPAAPIVGRSDMAYTWSGSELIVWGGRKADGTLLVDGARFDPVTRAWTTFSAPDASVLDGRIDATFGSDGAGGLFVWGGRATTSSGSSSGAKSNGAIYTPGVGWTAIPEVPSTMFAPTPKRYDMPGVIAKGKLWLLDGIVSSSSDVGGAGFVSYDLATGTWADVDMTNAPSPGTRGHHSVVWTGKEMLWFGGINGHTCCTTYNNGGTYRP